MSTRLAISFVSILLAACSGAGGSNSGNGTDAPADADPSLDPSPDPNSPAAKKDPAPSKQNAWAPPFPTIKNRGGKVIAHPRVMPIVFNDDPNAAAINDFTQKL